eukprot:jgi/Bigna1/90644/estExt_fgenesh1_pg.C_750064
MRRAAALLLVAFAALATLDLSRYRRDHSKVSARHGRKSRLVALDFLRFRGGGKVKSTSQHNRRNKINAGGFRHSPDARPDKKRERQSKNERHICQTVKQNNKHSRKRNTEYVVKLDKAKAKSAAKASEAVQAFHEARKAEVMKQIKEGTARYIFKD